MTNVPVGPLALFVYFGTVIVSIPASLMVYGFARRIPTRLSLVYVGAVVGALVLLGGVVVGVLVDPLSGAAVVAMALAGLVVLAGFPLLIGRQLIERWTPLPADDALEYAVLGWPVALVASFAFLLAPGGPGGYDLLAEPVAAALWTTLGLAVTLGPAIAGYGMYRLVAQLG